MWKKLGASTVKLRGVICLHYYRGCLIWSTEKENKLEGDFASPSEIVREIVEGKLKKS